MDQVDSPPAVEEFVSPSGNFLFVLHAPADWRNASPEGELFARNGKDLTSLWRRALPQEYRARFALVTDAGQVVMLDDWWNVPSRYAVLLVTREGQDGGAWSFDDVVAALGEPVSRVVALAKHGPWIAGPPKFDASGTAVLAPAGGKHLVIDPGSGTLSARP